jgi:hypothetical protein
MAMPRLPRLARAVLALLALATWCVVGLATQVHEAAASHVVCAEHGDVVEAGADAGGAAKTGDTGAAFRGGVDGRHDHGCAMPPVGTSTLLARALADVPGPPPAAVDLPTPRSGRWTRSALSFAPKTSPPRA